MKMSATKASEPVMRLFLQKTDIPPRNIKQFEDQTLLKLLTSLVELGIQKSQVKKILLTEGEVYNLPRTLIYSEIPQKRRPGYLVRCEGVHHFEPKLEVTPHTSKAGVKFEEIKIKAELSGIFLIITAENSFGANPKLYIVIVKRK